jgi:hypothetical protein
MRSISRDLAERLRPHLEANYRRPDDPDACWLWTGTKNQVTGYATIRVSNKDVELPGAFLGVHRVAYTLYRDVIPDGLTIDHLCKTPLCVNPDHLEPVTRGVNTLRSDNYYAVNARKTHCVRGHELPPYVTGGVRVCKPCVATRPRRNRAEIRAAGGVIPPDPTGPARAAASRAARLARGLDPADPRHGTYNGYNQYGCRCQPCRDARAAYGRARSGGSA